MPRKKPNQRRGREGSPIVVRDESGQASESISLSAQYSGPLPLPEHFAKYDQALPGAADRILTMAEVEGRQRRLRALIETVVYAGVAVGAIAFSVFRLWSDDVISVAIIGAAGLLAVALRRGF